MEDEQLTCWCADNVPPFACLWMKQVMNPSAMEEPIMVVGAPGSSNTGFVKRGTFSLTFNGQSTSPLAYNASAAAMQAALESLTSIGSGNVSVTEIYFGWEVRFIGSLAFTDVPMLGITNIDLVGGSPSVTISAEAVVRIPHVEKYTLTDPTPPGYVMFYFPDRDIYLDLIWANLDAASLESAINSRVGYSMVSVSGVAGNMDITFSGFDPYSVPRATVLYDVSHYTHGTAAITVTTPGVAGSDESQIIRLSAPDDLIVPDAAFEFYTPPPLYKEFLYTTNLKLNLVTNGMIAVPAKSIFYCRQLLFGVHWLQYDDSLDDVGNPKANPSDTWFFPRDDTWYLGSTNTKEAYGQSRDQLAHRVHGVVFRRIGRADESVKCVPVIMNICNFQVDDALSAA